MYHKNGNLSIKMKKMKALIVKNKQINLRKIDFYALKAIVDLFCSIIFAIYGIILLKSKNQLFFSDSCDIL